MKFFNRVWILRIFCFVFLLILNSCARKTPITPASFVRDGSFAYVQGPDGRWFIVSTTAKDLDAAMKKIQPGPASVDKLNLWIITPLGKPPAN
jgi:hypothetical protein